MLNKPTESCVSQSLKLLRRDATHNSLDLQFMDVAHSQRAAAESFIQDSFFVAYQTRLTSFYPVFLTTSDSQGAFSAIAGIRPAGHDKLFSEHYLDRPVEQILGVERKHVVEFGHLATANAGQARWLIIALSSFIYGAGFTHVIFTVVPSLYNAFRRMGLPLTKLANADKRLLPADETTEWGTYYDCNPVVYSGNLVTGQQALRDIARRDLDLYKISKFAATAGRALSRSNTAGSL